MTPSNKQVIALAIFGLSLYALALAASVFNFLKGDVIPMFNAITSFLILTYWLNKQFRITTHYFELREMIVLAFEVLIFGTSMFAILNHPSIAWLQIIGYVFFGLHFIAIILFLIFALTFKIKRLF
ncbi:MAG: hypothetical protein ABI477_05470 [Chryseolinea sp.]